MNIEILLEISVNAVKKREAKILSTDFIANSYFFSGPYGTRGRCLNRTVGHQ